MEIARALTKRYKPHETPNLSSSSDKQNGITAPNRTVSSRRPHKDSNASNSAINRAKISLPIELISTTNVLAYNAPDIYPQQQQQRDQVSSPSVSNPESVPSTASSSASTRSYDDSSSDRDGSTTSTNLTAASSVTTTPDGSREGSPAANFSEKSQQSHQLREYFNRSLASPTSDVASPSPIDKPERSGFDKQQQQPKQQKQQEPLSKLVTKDIPIVIDQLPTPQSPAPLVPTRALSHTKKTHQALARRRSRSRTSDPAHANASASGSSSTSSGSTRDQQAYVPPPLSPTSTVSTMNSSTLSLPTASSTPSAASNTTTNNNATASGTTTVTGPRTSQDMFSNRVANTAHPFGAELAQVKELAEEFGVKDVRVWSEEEQFLQDNGLCKFGVEDYLSEIRPLFAGVFADDVSLAAEGLYDRFGDAAVLASPNTAGSGYYNAPSKRGAERGRERARTTDDHLQNQGRDRAAECFAGGTAWF